MFRTALLFSGQGAQTVGMGKDLAQNFASAADLFRQADTILGNRVLSKLAYADEVQGASEHRPRNVYGIPEESSTGVTQQFAAEVEFRKNSTPLSSIMFDGPVETLTQTVVCQPALYVHGLVCLALLKEQLPNLSFHAAAGLSLGEFTAHAAAGTFDFTQGLRLVEQRAQFMQEACESTTGSMAAIIGAEEEKVRALAAAADVDVANFNSPGQIVISGEKSKIKKAIEIAKEYGARKAIELTVAGAFHSRLMLSAAEQLRLVLTETPITRPSLPVICNINALPAESPETIRTALADQVTGSVRWTETIEYLIDHCHCNRFLELGPGGTLAGLVSRIRKGTEVISISDTASLQAAVERLR